MSEELEQLIKEQQEAAEKLKEAYYKVLVRTQIEESPGKLEPSYEEQLSCAKFLAGFPGDGIEGEDALKLISLLASLTVLYRQKKAELRPHEIIEKVWHKPVTAGMIKYYQQLSILTELFITKDAKFSLHGYKTVSEMIDEIKRIMDLWLPF